MKSTHSRPVVLRFICDFVKLGRWLVAQKRENCDRSFGRKLWRSMTEAKKYLCSLEGLKSEFSLKPTKTSVRGGQ